jgi:hypothetical protein
MEFSSYHTMVQKNVEIDLRCAKFDLIFKFKQCSYKYEFVNLSNIIFFKLIVL